MDPSLAMPNPFNPLDWLSSAQDWFTRTEKSSGFRPYLIYLILCIGAGFCLLFIFPDRHLIEVLGITLIAVPSILFIPLYAWKSHVDPNFCRSESHVAKLRKYDLEMMGSESKQIQGNVIDNNLPIESIPEPKMIGNNGEELR